jgi:methylthioribose-1-phosphate isomerase
MAAYRAVAWDENELRLIDQRALPGELTYVTYDDYEDVADAIRSMVVRGAPAIGITAAYGMVLAARQSDATQVAALREDLKSAADVLNAARPTAVNLSWALKRIMKRVSDPKIETVDGMRAVVLDEARAIQAFEERSNEQIGQNALPLVPKGATFVHHCNTGPLATGGIGTALGVIITAHQAGKDIHAYVDETRPRLQGGRLTAWELQQWGVPHTVIVDGAAAHMMRTAGVDLCVVGCDRVAANGDTANKIGTYSLALAAHAHDVPFYVVGPTSTIDMDVLTGDEIEIESRPDSEVSHALSCRITPKGSPIANPAFDITPAHYITAIITERGIAYPPYDESLAALMVEAED